MSEAVDLLKLKLREMIEADREKIVARYFKWIKKGVEDFLQRRKPNLCPYEVYQAHGLPEPLGVYAATNFDEALKSLGIDAHRVKNFRPAFDVVLKPNADEIITRLAEKEVESMILMFLSRASEKLGPVVDRKTGIQMTKLGEAGGFHSGVWTGNIEFKFDDGTSFYAEMKVITNFTKYGKPYGQYPMTFHNAVLAADAPVKSMTPIEDIWASVSYVPPPPVKRPRWSKIVGPCVVMHEGQRHFIASPGVAKKMGIPTDAEQVARIEANEHYCYLELADGTRTNYKYTEEDKVPFLELEKNGNYNKAAVARKQFAYEHFFPE